MDKTEAKPIINLVVRGYGDLHECCDSCSEWRWCNEGKCCKIGDPCSQVEQLPECLLEDLVACL